MNNSRRWHHIRDKRLRHQRSKLRFFSRDWHYDCQDREQLPSIVVLTGAGISAESGIRTFRASDGLWEEHKVEDVATPEGYERDPQLVQAFYNQRRHQLLSVDVKPNAAHIALARLESVLGDRFLLVTQNIDNLHERAGSQRVVHMHGELLKARCPDCGHIVECNEDLGTECCQQCSSSKPLRPHIVWFGEMPLEMDRIYNAIGQCGYFLSIGTSGNVYPAAGFVQVAKDAAAHTVELNLEPSLVESRFDEKSYGIASETVPAYIKNLLLSVKKSAAD